VIGAKDVLFFWIEFGTVIHFVWNERQREEQMCPPPVKDPYQPELTSEKNGDKQQYKKNKEQYAEDR